MASASGAARAGRMRTSRGRASGLRGVDEKNRRMRNVVGPTTSSVLTICSRNPAMIEAIAITVAMPITTPRIVRPERSLLARSWSTAISQPSATEWSAMLLVTERFDRIEARRAQGGVHAEHDAHDQPESQRQGDRPERDARRQRRGGAEERGGRRAGDQAGAASQQREGDRLRQELTSDVPAGGAERLPHADLMRPLGRSSA